MDHKINMLGVHISKELPGSSNIAILWVFLIKQLFHSCLLLRYKIVMANLALHASLAI